MDLMLRGAAFYRAASRNAHTCGKPLPYGAVGAIDFRLGHVGVEFKAAGVIDYSIGTAEGYSLIRIIGGFSQFFDDRRKPAHAHSSSPFSEIGPTSYYFICLSIR